MTNGEKYKEQVLDITLEGDTTVAVCKGKLYPCKNTPCENCQFYETGMSCTASLIRWLYKEYKEERTLTEGQYHFLKALSNGARIEIRDGAVIIQAMGVNGQDNLYMSKQSMNHYFSGVPDLKPNVCYEVSEILKWEVEK